MSNFPHYTTIVLTGGFGTRLSSVVPDQPKILAPIGNTPFLTYFLEWFSNSSGDLSDIILATGYLHDQITKFVHDNILNLRISREISPIGTLGAILNALEMVNHDHILILNGDTLFNFNFKLMLSEYLAYLNPLLLLKSRIECSLDKGYIIKNQNCGLPQSYSFSLGAFFISKNDLKYF